MIPQSDTDRWIRPAWWAYLVVLIFAAVYANSLTFVYSDSDDATSIAYHALGRNGAVQPPFESFQFGMDVLLTLLPADEHIVRTVAMSVTALASVVLVLLMLQLSFEHAGIPPGGMRTMLSVALLLGAPEFFYLGLLYTPMLMGMCCAVGAHLLLRRALTTAGVASALSRHEILMILLSGFLMGAAGFFRWDILAYGMIVVFDMVLDPTGILGRRMTGFWRRVGLSFLWGIPALLLWAGLVLSTGNMEEMIAETLVAMKETSAEASIWEAQFLAAHLSLFSPGFLLLSLTGLVSVVSTGGSKRWFFLLPLLLCALWPFWATPKEMLVFVPLFVILFVAGGSTLHRTVRVLRGRYWIQFAVLLLFVLPWVFGIRVLHGDSSWGPGFEIRPFSHAPGGGIRDLRVVAGAGAGCPTNEGPRPVFGHAAVLLGGGWRTLASTLDAELGMAATTALRESLPYLILRNADGLQVATAARMGFVTSDPEKRRHVETPVVRRFHDPAGRQLLFVTYPYEEFVQDTGGVLLAMQCAGKEKVLVWSETGYIRRLYRLAPEALEERGLQTAVLDFRRLLVAVRKLEGGTTP